MFRGREFAWCDVRSSSANQKTGEEPVVYREIKKTTREDRHMDHGTVVAVYPRYGVSTFRAVYPFTAFLSLGLTDYWTVPAIHGVSL